MAQVTIHLDTDVPADKAALAQLFGSAISAVVSSASKPVEILSSAAEVPAPAPKAPAKPKATPKPAPAPEPTPEPVEEDLLGGETDFAALRESAVHKATELVTNGGSAKVREALSSLGAKRVTEVSDAQLEEFVALLG